MIFSYIMGSLFFLRIITQSQIAQRLRNLAIQSNGRKNKREFVPLFSDSVRHKSLKMNHLHFFK